MRKRTIIKALTIWILALSFALSMAMLKIMPILKDDYIGSKTVTNVLWGFITATLFSFVPMCSCILLGIAKIKLRNKNQVEMSRKNKQRLFYDLKNISKPVEEPEKEQTYNNDKEVEDKACLSNTTEENIIDLDADLM